MPGRSAAESGGLRAWGQTTQGGVFLGCSPSWRATDTGVYFLGLVAPLAGAVAGLPAFGADFFAGLAWSFIRTCS
jgi:hypothetical protein